MVNARDCKSWIRRFDSDPRLHPLHPFIPRPAMNPADLRYTKSHEWVRLNGSEATVGITHFAQAQLGDLTFVELPDAGDAVGAGDDVAVVESVKAASDVYSPLAGTVSAVNGDLNANPGLINTDPFGAGWMFKLTLANPADAAQLLTADQYAEFAPDAG
jgi:glycine cleavage system H protein